MNSQFNLIAIFYYALEYVKYFEDEFATFLFLSKNHFCLARQAVHTS